MLTFLHWRYPPETVQALLPDGLEVETFDGVAWVGLIPFLMDRVRPRWLPPVPWLSRFPETNVRTYVRGPDGRTGIWFFSLDAARLPAVLAARVGFGLPYYWSEMSVRAMGDMGITWFLEAGPGDVLGKLARRAVSGSTVKQVGSPDEAQAAAAELRQALGLGQGEIS